MAYLSSCEDNKRASSASSSSKGNKHIHNDDDDEIHHHIPKPRSLLTQSLEGYFQDRVLENVKPYEGYFKNIAYAASTERNHIRSIINCLDKELVDARNVWSERKAVLDKRWKEAEEKNRRTYERVPQFSPFYKETFIKRHRSLKKLERERAQILDKDRDTRRILKEVDKLKEVKANVEHRLEKFSVFRSYLERTKESSKGEYKDIRELMDRYGVLAEARGTLMAKNKHFRDSIALRQRALEKDIVTKSNEVLMYRNYLYELLDYDTSLQDQVFRLDESLVRIKTTAAGRTLVIGQIKMSINNLYLQICSMMHRHTKLSTEDTLGQLLDIRISIKEVSRLSKDIRRMLKAAHMTARTEEKARQKLQRLQEERQKRLDRIAKKTKFDPKSLFQIPNALTTKGLPEIVSRRFNIKAEKTQEELSSSLAEQQKLRILRMS